MYHYVLLGDPASQTRSGNGSGSNALLGHQLVCGGRRVSGSVGFRLGRRSCCRLWSRSGRRLHRYRFGSGHRCRSVAGVNGAEDIPDLGGFARLEDDFQNAGGFRRKRQGRLVGFNLAKRLVHLDIVAIGLQPALGWGVVLVDVAEPQGEAAAAWRQRRSGGDRVPSVRTSRLCKR